LGLQLAHPLQLPPPLQVLTQLLAVWVGWLPPHQLRWHWPHLPQALVPPPQ